MTKYFCPLCKQEVRKELFEKITGIWSEKEKRLASLKRKEADLKKREEGLQAKYRKERLQFVQQEKKKMKLEMEKERKQNKAILAKDRRALVAEKAEVRKYYQERLAKEIDKALVRERRISKETQKSLRLQFENSARRKVEVAQAKLEKDRARLERKEKTQSNRYEQLNRQFSAMQCRSKSDLEKRDKKIQSLEEQIKKSRTPQVLGLLEEDRFLAELSDKFPADTFEHPGKGGDIVHRVNENGKENGILVYELKKVAHYNREHIEQTYEAKKLRQADYALLVTNAKRKKDEIGFSITKGIIVIHPAGAMVLISILRENILAIARLKLSREQRELAVKNVLGYLQSPAFRNGIEGIIIETVELYRHLEKEAKDHYGSWGTRLSKYRAIHNEAFKIKTKVVGLLNEGQEYGERKEIEIGPIALPAKIE